MTEISIRSAEEGDLTGLAEVSRAADALFAQVGLDLPPDEPLADLRAADHVIMAEVSAPDEALPVGVAALVLLRESVHLTMLGVSPDHHRRGIGSALLEAVCAWTERRKYPAVTLTTFRNVSFNAPWYARRGFVEVPRDALSPELAELDRREAVVSGEQAPRVVMLRRCGPPPGA